MECVCFKTFSLQLELFFENLFQNSKASHPRLRRDLNNKRWSDKDRTSWMSKEKVWLQAGWNKILRWRRYTSFLSNLIRCFHWLLQRTSDQAVHCQLNAVRQSQRQVMGRSPALGFFFCWFLSSNHSVKWLEEAPPLGLAECSPPITASSDWKKPRLCGLAECSPPITASSNGKKPRLWCLAECSPPITVSNDMKNPLFFGLAAWGCSSPIRAALDSHVMKISPSHTPYQ